jgi:hypothetical protein
MFGWEGLKVCKVPLAWEECILRVKAVKARIDLAAKERKEHRKKAKSQSLSGLGTSFVNRVRQKPFWRSGEHDGAVGTPRPTCA